MIVTLIDINDNAPRLDFQVFPSGIANNIFVGAISIDAFAGTKVMDIPVSKPKLHTGMNCMVL